MTTRSVSSGQAGAARLKRWLWRCTWSLLFLPTPPWSLRGWRRALLRLFGARIGPGAVIKPTCYVTEPWHLVMGPLSCLADHVYCDSAAPVTLGAQATVSQNAFLLTSVRDPDTTELDVVCRPITIGEHAWVAANAVVEAGVDIGAGGVVGACSLVNQDVAPWTVVGGNPSRLLRARRADTVLRGRTSAGQ